MNLILSILMLGGLGMTAGAVLAFRRTGLNRQAVLMIGAALVMFANVAILVWPVWLT